MSVIMAGDCLEVLPTLEANSIDACVTDPPAGISFMGKAWDHDRGGRRQWVEWMTEVFTEVYRVMKPGAHGLVWSLPRTSHWTAWALEDAGFEVRDKVLHLFGSGFPKGIDVSKAIDKAAGAERLVIGINPLAAKQTGQAGTSSHGDRFLNEHVTAPATNAARQWEGWNTALKPAFEEWWLIRKPLVGTVAQNVLTYGTGALNVDGCRIGDDVRRGDCYNGQAPRGSHGYTNPSAKPEPWAVPAGRWPPNVVLSHVTIPVVRLSGIIPPDIRRDILEYFDGRGTESAASPVRRDDLSVLQADVRVSSVMGEGRTAEVLSEGLPQRMAEDSNGSAQSSLWEAAHSECETENVQRSASEESPPTTGRGETPILEGGGVLPRGLSVRAQRESLEGRSSASTHDDSEGSIRPRASTGDGPTTRATVEEIRDGASHQRDERRQQAGESRASGDSGPLAATSGDGPRIRAATSGERVLEVPASDVPLQWQQYFEDTGRDLGCQEVGTKRVKGISGGTGNHNGSVYGARSNHGQPVKDYANPDGTETVAAWECVESCAVRMLDEQSGERPGGGSIRNGKGMGYQGGDAVRTREPMGDTGGASRFFYCSKASSAERGAFNSHPTVKPLALMQWLVRLVTPAGGTVLDPFCGSGSTLLAADREGFDFIGIDKDPHAVEIAERRFRDDAGMFANLDPDPAPTAGQRRVG